MVMPYGISCEIAGPCAMFTRPDTGDSPVSYPVPTASAVRGIFESVLWGPAVAIIPRKVEICSPVRYENYTTNYGGPLRSSGAVNSGNNYQLPATILVDMCYKLYATAEPLRKNRSDMPESARKWDSRTTSPGHAYQAIFGRRLRRGQCFSVPSLGWSEFKPAYFGPLRNETAANPEINLVIPSFVQEIFPDGYATAPRFVFSQNMSIINGVFEYSYEEEREHD